MIPIDILDHLTFPPILAVGGAGGAAVNGTWGGLLFYIGIALGVSFFCSVLEAILLSTSLSHIEMSAEDGNRGASLMQKHKADVERPISAILTLNTVAHTVGAAGAGAQAVAIFGDAWFGVISAVLTLLILVFSEIIPKTIGATYWKQLNGFAAYAIQFLVVTLLPVVWLLEMTTQVLKSEDEQPTVSRMEIEAMSRIGANEGTLDERDYNILRNLLQLSNIPVHKIMTPRTVVVAFQEDTTVRDVLEKNPTLPFSRLPVYRENMDDIEGFVLRYDLFHAFANDGADKPLSELKRPIAVIPESNDVASVMDTLISKQIHIGLVIDEYGGTAGLVTMEDAIETMLGIEITDESDTAPDLRKVAQQRYKRQQEMLRRLNNTPTLSNITGEAPQTGAD